MLTALLAGCLAITQCRPGYPDRVFRASECFPQLGRRFPDQTCSQEYAGELLAYFMRVTLGHAGRLEQRKTWRTRALNQPLELETIDDHLNGAGQDKSKLMVLDANMLGFSEVLYYYDPLLNQFKGRFVYHSIYPSSGLIALRILLLQKIHRDEKVNLREVLAREDLLFDPSKEPDRRDLEKMNLQTDEYRLLRQVLEADPQFGGYLKNPFLIKALADIGAIQRDGYVSRQILLANYRGAYTQDRKTTERAKSLTIAILPSMTKEFTTAGSPGEPGGSRLLPTEVYQTATTDLEQAILEKTLARFQEAVSTGRTAVAGEDTLRSNIEFFSASKRPLLVYPENADQVLADICPWADYTIILLGENVYRAMDIQPHRDVYPAVNRVYLDIADVRHRQVEMELDQISDFIFSRLRGRLLRSAPAPRSQIPIGSGNPKG